MSPLCFMFFLLSPPWLSFLEGFWRFTLTFWWCFLSLFVTDYVSYLHNNAWIRNTTNRSVSGGSTPNAENRCQCLTWVLSKKQKQEKEKKPHPRPPAPLSCQSCSGMCFVFSTGGKASASSAAHRCRLSEAGAHCHKVWRFLALLRRVHFSRLTFFILKSLIDTWNKNESQNAPNMNKKEIIHRQETRCDHIMPI